MGVGTLRGVLKPRFPPRMSQDLLWRPIWCHFCPKLGGSGFRSQLAHFFPCSSVAIFFPPTLGPLGPKACACKRPKAPLWFPFISSLPWGERILRLHTRYLVPGKKCASWLRNPDPPNPGQNLHEMGRHKSFWTILRSSWGFKTPRIFLDGSRPPQLNFVLMT